jgi:serine carboxypeptidase-like clade II
MSLTLCAGDPALYDPCIDDEVTVYLNKPDVQHAIHANTSGTLPGPWAGCNELLRYSRADLLSSVLPLYKHKLLGKGVHLLSRA